MVNYGFTFVKALVAVLAGLICSGIFWVIFSMISDGPASYYLSIHLIALAIFIGLTALIYAVWSRYQERTSQ